MKIKTIRIQNFRSIKNEIIRFPESGLLALVGSNNAGKSNLLRAVDNILGEGWFSGDKAEINDYFMKNRDETIRIEICFDDGRKVKFDSSEAWPKYFDERGGQIYSSQGNVKNDFPCTYLAANRDLAKHMQFRSYELLGKIAKSFNNQIDDSTKASLESKFNDVMADLESVGSFLQFKQDFMDYFSEMQSDSPYKLSVDFKAFTPLNYFKTINILANDSSVNDSFDIDPIELGEGNKSLMLFALVRSYAKNFKQEASGILAIEEPEIYLHPQARRYLYRIFNEIVSNSNIQIIYTTHSPDLIVTEDFPSVGLVTKESTQGTKVKIVTEDDLVTLACETGVPTEKTNRGNIKDFYATTSNSKLNEGFFAKHLILVEGETEELCLPLLLEQLGVDCLASGISVLGVGGKNQIPKYWRLFSSFGVKTSVIIDSDDGGNKNIAACFGCSPEELDSTEEVFKSLRTPRQLIHIFEKNFENAIQKDFDNNSKWESYQFAAKEHINPTKDTQKPQIDRYIVRKLIEDGYVPAFLKPLVADLEKDSNDSNE